jgi:hypothetical protein
MNPGFLGLRIVIRRVGPERQNDGSVQKEGYICRCCRC